MKIKDRLALDRAKRHLVNKLIPLIEENFDLGAREFRLTMDRKGVFYIHPLGIDGKSMDFYWKDLGQVSYSHDFNEED